jgi:pimeloyl-ACP methyl ester carboxylesterase
MTPYFTLSLRLTFLATLVLAFATGCEHVPVAGRPQSRLAPKVEEPPPQKHDDVIASLPCRWTDANYKLSQKTTVILVPGSGNQNVVGLQSGNGFKPYSSPIEIGTLWQEKLARSGYDVLAYDKRTSSSGPKALAEDVDAACEAVQKRFGSRRPIILWSSEQGTQVVLNSKCVQSASALVLISPIPDSLDRVWISGLKEGGFRDRALSLSATFDSIRKDLFEPDAKIMGASLTFWKNWLNLAEKTPDQLVALKTPTLFVVGQEDVWLGSYGRSVLERVVKSNKKHKILVVAKADRNLLQKETLSQASMETIVGALKSLGKLNGQ